MSLIISRSVIRMRNVSHKGRRDNQNTHITFSNFFLPKILPAVYAIMWQYNAEPGRPQMKMWHMRIECCLTSIHTHTHTYTHTHLEYVILNTFPLQQWLHERDLQLLYKYIACLMFVLSSHSSLTLAVVSRCDSNCVV